MSQNAMTGKFTYAVSEIGCESVLGSVMITTLGSLNSESIWLVYVPGMCLPAMAFAPVYCANFKTAL